MCRVLVLALAILLLPFFQTAYAQISLPSVFPEMRSLNPAVISLRKTGYVKVSGIVDKIEKDQAVKTINNSPFVFDDKSDINLTNINFFRGGKGAGFTSEWFFDYTKGDKVTEITDANGDKTEYTTDTSSYYASYAFGSGRGWGLQLNYVGYASEYGYTANINGSPQASKFEQDITVFGARPGIVLGSTSLAIGVFAEYSTFKAETEGAPDSSSLIGIAIGSGGTSGLIEVGFEADPITKRDKDPSTNETAPMPTRASFLIERKFSSITLGYKGMAYRGQFLDFDKIIQNQLIYVSAGDEVRLEHIFNFSFGGGRGFTFGGSASYSNYSTKEKSSIYASPEKHDTAIKSMSLGVRIGYLY